MVILTSRKLCKSICHHRQLFLLQPVWQKKCNVNQYNETEWMSFCTNWKLSLLPINQVSRITALHQCAIKCKSTFPKMAIKHKRFIKLACRIQDASNDSITCWNGTFKSASAVDKRGGIRIKLRLSSRKHCIYRQAESNERLFHNNEILSDALHWTMKLLQCNFESYIMHGLEDWQRPIQCSSLLQKTESIGERYLRKWNALCDMQEMAHMNMIF